MEDIRCEDREDAGDDTAGEGGAGDSGGGIRGGEVAKGGRDGSRLRDGSRDERRDT